MKLFNMFMSPYMDELDKSGAGSDDLEDFNNDLEDIDSNKEDEINTGSEKEVNAETNNENKEQLKIKIKYNHEEKELSHEEAAPWIQKGMNYDKVFGELDTLKKSPVLSYVDKIAKQFNMTVDEVVSTWQKQDEQNEIQALADREKVPYEIAERLYKNEQKTNQLEKMFNTDKQTKANQEKQEAEYNEFFENFPDVKPEAIPKEVWEHRTKTGKSLSDAMTWHENKQLKERIKVLETNASNTKKAPITNGVTTHGGKEITEEDDFLKGFNSI